MGRAEIVTDSGDGYYRIKVLHDTARSAVLLAQLQTSLANTELRLTTETDETAIAVLNLRKTALQKEIVRINDIIANADYEAPAWCADYTAGMTGIVGTIDIAADSDKGINIQPGYEGGQAWNHARDGQHLPFLTMPVADAILNFTLMPAIQKWRPTYRYATISNVDQGADTCTATLWDETSRFLDIDINIQRVYHNVPITYMECDSAVFENGDDVIIKFDPYRSDGQPTVIGFHDNPRPCGECDECVLVRMAPLDYPDQPGYILWDPYRNMYYDHPDLDGVTWPASRNDIATFLTKTTAIANSDDDYVWLATEYHGEVDGMTDGRWTSSFSLGGTYYADIEESTVDLSSEDCDGDSVDDTTLKETTGHIYLDAVGDTAFEHKIYTPGVTIWMALASAYLACGGMSPAEPLYPLRFAYELDYVSGNDSCTDDYYEGAATLSMHTPLGSIEGISLSTWDAAHHYAAHGDISPSSIDYSGSRASMSFEIPGSGCYTDNTIVQIFAIAFRRFTNSVTGYTDFSEMPIAGGGAVTTYESYVAASAKYWIDDNPSDGIFPTDDKDPTGIGRSGAFEDAVGALLEYQLENYGVTNPIFKVEIRRVTQED